ncbi:MAG: hypothetical protein RSB23_08075 [Alistipes sp.]
MKPTEKQKTIAEQAVYGDLKIKYPDEDTLWTIKPTALETDCTKLILPMFHQEESLPILRSMYDLNKTITHKGYNDNKPFTPLMVLFAIKLNPRAALTTTATNDLLYYWHFDTRGLIEAGEAIDANTLEVNPYEV